MGKRYHSLSRAINTDSEALKKKLRLLKHLKKTKPLITRSLAEDFIQEDTRTNQSNEEKGLVPIPEPQLNAELIYENRPREECQSFNGNTSSQSNYMRKTETLFSIPSITSLEEAGLQQYYNSFLNTTRWQVSNLNVKPGDNSFLFWFVVSSYLPLICSCSGPMSNMFSLFAIICPWKIKKDDSSFTADPLWCYLVNSISIFFALASNGFLLLNYRRVIRYTYCQVISICGWLVASLILSSLVIFYHWWFYHNHHDVEYIIGYGFWFAIMTVVLHFINFLFLSLNEFGFLAKKYRPMFNINHVQSSLIVQTCALCIWIIIGATVFTRFLNLNLADSMFYCIISIVTVGSQQFVPDKNAAQVLTSLWIVVGLVIFGLIISSIRQMIVEFSRSTIQWHRRERMRQQIYRHHEKEIGNKNSITPNRAFELITYAIDRAYKVQEIAELSISVFIFLITLLCGGIGFTLLENWSYKSSVYFCFFTLITLGQGDTLPIHPGGYVFFSIWALAAIPVMTILVSTASDFVFSKLTEERDSHLVDLFMDYCLAHTILKPIGLLLQRKKFKIDLTVEKLMDISNRSAISVNPDSNPKNEIPGTNVPILSHPIDLLTEVLMNQDKVDDLEFINSLRYLETNTLSVHLANYNREGYEADYDPDELREVRGTIIDHILSVDHINLEAFKSNYLLDPVKKEVSSENSVINKDNIIETGFRKKDDYVLSMLSKIQVVIIELKKTSILMATRPEYKHSFGEWDKFLKITDNKEYENNPLYFVERDSPLSFPTNEPSYFALHYLRFLNLVVQEFAAEYDQMDTSIPMNGKD